jgi:hypothetical protein
METVYFYCAVVGGTVLLLQTLMLVFGLGHADAEFDADTDPGDVLDTGGHGGGHGHAADGFFKVLSFKTLVAFVTFFGLGGLACLEAGMKRGSTLAAALAMGIAALWLVAWLMSALGQLQSSGNLDLQNAVGATGTVYLRIPARRQGPGKVTVVLQGRSVQCKATTADAEIPTGSAVRIVGLASPDTLEVLPTGMES